MCYNWRQHHDDYNKCDLGQLLIQFFDFYGNYFNYYNTGISVVNGGTFFPKVFWRQVSKEREKRREKMWKARRVPGGDAQSRAGGEKREGVESNGVV